MWLCHLPNKRIVLVLTCSSRIAIIVPVRRERVLTYFLEKPRPGIEASMMALKASVIFFLQMMQARPPSYAVTKGVLGGAW